MYKQPVYPNVPGPARVLPKPRTIKNLKPKIFNSNIFELPTD